ncbi:MAG TPA: thermonuclease family protein, partial [Acidimicrobiales bacterium]
MPTPLVAVATAGLVGLVAVLGLGVVATLAGGGIDGLLATWGGVPDRGPGPVAPPSPGAAVVVHVVDGDTLVVRFRGGGEARLRLIGIDTPESVATDRPNECFGQEASAALAALLPAGTPVRVERDVEPRDRYDRLLGYVYR